MRHATGLISCGTPDSSNCVAIATFHRGYQLELGTSRLHFASSFDRHAYAVVTGSQCKACCDDKELLDHDKGTGLTTTGWLTGVRLAWHWATIGLLRLSVTTREINPNSSQRDCRANNCSGDNMVIISTAGTSRRIHPVSRDTATTIVNSLIIECSIC